MEALSYIQQIGGTIGIPAAPFIAWLFWSVKSLAKRVDKLETENTGLQVTLTKIQADIAYIRGLLDKKK